MHRVDGWTERILREVPTVVISTEDVARFIYHIHTIQYQQVHTIQYSITNTINTGKIP